LLHSEDCGHQYRHHKTNIASAAAAITAMIRSTSDRRRAAALALRLPPKLTRDLSFGCRGRQRLRRFKGWLSGWFAKRGEASELYRWAILEYGAQFKDGTNRPQISA
jgi:hypothetical protein